MSMRGIPLILSTPEFEVLERLLSAQCTDPHLANVHRKMLALANKMRDMERLREKFPIREG